VIKLSNRDMGTHNNVLARAMLVTGIRAATIFCLGMTLLGLRYDIRNER